MFDRILPKNLSKKQMFIGIIGILVLTTVAVSLITRITFIEQKDEEVTRIAVVGPMTGRDALIGQSLREGVELMVSQVNARGGIQENRVVVDVYDDENNPDTAEIVAGEIVASRASAVIGHWSPEVIARVADTYSAGQIPHLIPAPLRPGAAADTIWGFPFVFNDGQQARFLANYARNVLGHKLVSVIGDADAYGDTLVSEFEKTYLRFGTQVRYKWLFNPSFGGTELQIDGIVEELKARRDAGLIFLAVNERDGAMIMKKMRDLRIRNPIIVPANFGTHAFVQAVEDGLDARTQPGLYTNDTLIAAPLLFDTANEVAQNFRNAYQDTYDRAPDWLAAYAYDAANMAVDIVALAAKETDRTNVPEMRAAVQAEFETMNKPTRGWEGLTGTTYFDAETGEAQKPVLVGIFNGLDIISALTQLQPIKSQGGANYIEELKQGKVLYVNDRFMYKTNVVYTGIEVNEISDLDFETGTFTMDFNVWYRYRGDFSPEELFVVNARESIDLGEPVDEKMVDDMTYRLYRAKHTFVMDYADANRAYGEHLVGISFSHKTLNRNNLLYVVDVLGLGLNSGGSVMGALREKNALPSSTGWEMERAWISQDVVGKTSAGNPDYVGFAATDPLFSQVDLGIVVKEIQINVRDFIPAEYFLYIGIFGLLGIIFAVTMDRRERGRFWSVQSWGLRVVAWPAFLLAASNLSLDIAVRHLSDAYVDKIVMVFDCLWYIVPARLVGIAIERFVWQPLEDHTERTIPNVIRVFASVAIYSLASFGIIAFVFDQHVTSLLATSGLLAMIVGLAVQANISNIFSGIVINVERPFNVGDWVRIGDMDEGRVVDITWRTTRVKTRNGYVISTPNGQVSESQVHNFDSFDVVRIELPMYLDGRLDPEETSMIMMIGLEKAENIVEFPEREIRFKGVENIYGKWTANYEIQFWIDNYGRREEIMEGALSMVWRELRNNGISPMTFDDVAHEHAKTRRAEIEAPAEPVKAGE
jgi:potassium efflux system protein